MIITDDKSPQSDVLPSPTLPSGSGARPQLQQASSSEPKGAEEPKEYADAPPAYESVVSESIANISDAPRSGSPQASRSASIRRAPTEAPTAQEPPSSTSALPQIPHPSTSSLQPHYYSVDSYGAPVSPSANSPARSLVTYISTKMTPMVHNPPTLFPPSFVRPAPPSLSYDLFQPTYLVDLGGLRFPLKPPPSQVQPHPFVTHDVNQADWTRFLGDIRNKAIVRPAESRGGILSAVDLIGDIIVASKGNSRPKTVGTLVDLWNEHFFHPRRLEAVLARGRKRLDSGSGPVPDLEPFIEAIAPKLVHSTSTSDLRTSSKDLVLKSKVAINEKKREMSKMLEPINGGGAGKGKGRQLDANDMRHRLFLVGF